ncbi:MAG: DUF4054 domain-containing protein [bacterium]
MTDTSQTKVLTIAPELSGVRTSVWTLILADVAAEVTFDTYGSRQEIAQRYLAAHYLTLIKDDPLRRADAAGPVASDSSGQVSTNYVAVNYRDRNRYDETLYGRMFNQIRKSVAVPFTVITP